MKMTEKEEPGKEIVSMLRGRKFKTFINSQFADLRKEYDLKQIEVEALIFYEKNPDAAACEAYRSMDLNKGYLSTALYDLCQAGYMISGQSSESRRVVHYEITEKGYRVLTQIKQIRYRLFRYLFDGISEEEMEILKKAAEKISWNIDRIGISE